MDAPMPENMAQMAGPQSVPQETSEQDDSEGEAEFLAEAKRGLDGIRTALFKDKNVSDSFISMIKPDNPEDGLVRAAILLITELDKKLDLDEEVLAPMAAMAAGELMELVEAAHGITFDEAAQKRVVMASFEGLLQAYGVDEQAAADFVGEVGPEAEQQGIDEYSAAMKGAESAQANRAGAQQAPQGRSAA